MGESPREYCGLFGIYNHADAARMTYLGLYALQHRGEESAGMVTSDGRQFYTHKGMGLVGDVFKEDDLIRLPGSAAIGHVRYSTTGSSQIHNAQPLLDDGGQCSIAIAHNGNLNNASDIRSALESQGHAFHTSVDSEVILRFLSGASANDLPQRLAECLRQLRGAFSLVLMTEDALIGVRDPQGFRPLCLGKIDDTWVLASETCAFDLIDAELVRELAPGEMVWIDAQGPQYSTPYDASSISPSMCIFEHVYFARPDSIIFGEQVEVVRYRMGKALASEHPVDADMVMPVPDSGNFAALGYSHASGIPFAWGMVRNHYVGRTFIQPHQGTRDFQVRIKLNPLKSVLKGRRVIVVDDSIVRGTTSKHRIAAIRKAGAREIHMRISCPPTRHPCYYGIDFPSERELIAANNSVEDIGKYLEADSLGYLSLRGLLSAVSGKPTDYCTACFSGEYPLPKPGEINKHHLESRC